MQGGGRVQQHRCQQRVGQPCVQFAQQPIAAGRRIVPRPIRDGDTVRVIPAGPDFDDLLALAFTQILENAHGNTVVLLRLLRAIEEIRAGTSHPVRLRLLDAKRDGIAEVARRTASSSEARRAIEAQLAGKPVVADMAGA